MLINNNIINDIYKLENNVFVAILLKKYVELKNLAEISVDLNYSYIHIRESHGKALNALKNVLSKEYTQTYNKV